MPIIGAFPYTLTNGTTADATQVMADLNKIRNDVNANAASLGSTALSTANNNFTVPQSGQPAVAGANFPIASQVQNFSFNTLTSELGTNILTARCAQLPLAAYSTGQVFNFIPSQTNTAPAVTMTIDAAGTVPISKYGLGSVAQSDLVMGRTAWLVFNQTALELLNPATVQTVVNPVGAVTNADNNFSVAQTGQPATNSNQFATLGQVTSSLGSSASPTVNNNFTVPQSGQPALSSNQFPTAGQVQNVVFNTLVSNLGTNSITARCTQLPLTAYASGQVFSFIPSQTNTSPTVGITVDSAGLIPISKFGLGSIASSDLIAGRTAYLIVNSTALELLNPATALQTPVGTGTPVSNSSPNLQGTTTLGNERVFVSNSNGNTYVFDPGNSDSQVATVSVGVTGFDFAYCPDNGKIYQANQSGSVAVIDSTTYAETSISTGGAPTGICYCPGNKKIYVANGANNTVLVIDPTTNTVVTTISDSRLGTCNGIAADGSGVVYVSNGTKQSIALIDSTRNVVYAQYTTGISPYGVCYAPGPGLIFVANNGGSSVSIFGTSASTWWLNGRTINTPASPWRLTYASGANKVLVTCQDATPGHVVVIDPQTFTQVASVQVGSTPEGIAYSSLSRLAYIANNSTVISVFDPATQTVVKNITGVNAFKAVGVSFSGAAAQIVGAPATDAYGLVTLSQAQSVSASQNFSTPAQVQNGAYTTLTSTIGTNTINARCAALTLNSYTTGQIFNFIPAQTNTSASVEIQIDNLGSTPISKHGLGSLVASDLVAGRIALIGVNSYALELLNPQTGWAQ